MDAELRAAYRTLTVYNFFLVQPFDFDPKLIRLHLDRSKLKKAIFLGATANAYCVTFYKIFIFLKSIFQLVGSKADGVDQAHFTIHFVLLSGYICVMFRIIVIYLVYPKVIISVFNRCTQNLTRKAERSTGVKAVRGSVFLLLVMGQVGLNSFFLLVYMFTCHISPQFIYASVPDDYRSGWVQLGLAFVEVYAFVYIVSMGFFVLFIQLLFFASIFDTYQRSLVRLR